MKNLPIYYKYRLVVMLAMLVFGVQIIAQNNAMDAARKGGKWVDPVSYFHLNRYGEKLTMDAIADAMWEKERYIRGMKVTTYSIARVKDDPRKTSLPFNTPQTTYIYMNGATSINAVSDCSQNTMMGVYMLEASNISFSFDEASHQYSFSYEPVGSYNYDDPKHPKGADNVATADIQEELDKWEEQSLKIQQEIKAGVPLEERTKLTVDIMKVIEKIQNSENHQHYKSVPGMADMSLVYTEKQGLCGYFLVVIHDNSLGVVDPYEHHYVYFHVDEVLLDGEDAPLSEEQRGALIEQLDNLTEALEEYVGLTGDHSGPIASTIISTISSIAAILLANGVSTVTGSSGGFFGEDPTPPPTEPEGPPTEPQQPANRREEDEQPTPPKDQQPEEPQPEEPQPEEPPQPAPEDVYWKQYVTVDEEGTLSMRDPATGKIMQYYLLENGEYLSETGFTYPMDMLKENLRLRADNSDYFAGIAQKAERDVAEQREQNARIDAETQARGDAYRAEREAEEKAEAERQAYLNKLAEKYGVEPTEEAIREALRAEQDDAERENEMLMQEAKTLDRVVTTLEVVDKACEVTVNIMGDCVPGGAAVKNVYTFAHSVAAAGGKAYADGANGAQWTGALLTGAADGLLGVVQNKAGDWTKNIYVEGVAVVGTEGIRKGLEAIADGKSGDDVNNAMLHGITSKLNNFLIGKGVAKTIDWVGKSADQSLHPYEVPLSEDTGLRFGEQTAKEVKSFLRGKIYMGSTDGMVKVNGIVSATGEIGGLVNNYGLDNVSNFVTDTAIPGTIDDVKYYTELVKEFSDSAAKYKEARDAAQDY